MVIRNFDEDAHLAGVRACMIELQDFERALDPRMPPGAEIVDTYVPQMLDRCQQCGGIVLVAEVDNEVAGYATVLVKVRNEEIEDGDVEYGLVSDLVVSSRFRRRGIGRQLLEAAESFARGSDMQWLRIGVLAQNRAAASLYDNLGFKSLYAEREKELRD
jgi:ribosomal protein S18 acetylase RimI-like enzyme